MSGLQPRYTIEQYELLRRLRATGMTKEEMISAITAMEKLDNDLGPLPEKRIQIKDVHTIPRVYTGTNDNQSVSSSAYPHQSSLQSSASQSPVTIPSAVVQQQNTVLAMHGQRSSESSQMPSSVYLMNNSVSGQEPVMDVEAEAEFHRLISHDPTKLWEEIKMFILGHDISQSWLSKGLGIQKGILSHYLLSGRGLTKNAIKLLYSWYHLSNRGNHQSQQSRTEGQTRPIFSRRDRLHWSEKELQILESYRKENAYPSMNEVRSIADTLNSLSIEDICGEHRVITPMNVYNWFANRRKDRKRKAREIANGQTSDASGDVESLDSVDDLLHDQLSPNASNMENIPGTSNLPTNTDFFSQITTNPSQRSTDVVNQLGVAEISVPTSIMAVPVTLEVHGSSLKDEEHGFVGHVRSLLEN